MNMQSLLGVIIAIAVLGGGAWYLSQTKTPMEEGAPTASGETGSATFADFVAQGGSRSCDVVVNNPAAPATGVVFVSGTNIRADMVAKPVTAGGMEISAHVIQADGYVYSWTDMLPQGVKVAVADGMGAAANYGFDMNADVQYDCSPWIPDPSKFSVPTNVTFMEVGAQGTTQ